MIISEQYFIDQMQGSIPGVEMNISLEETIEDVTGVIEDYLGRKVSVEKYHENVADFRISDGAYLPLYRPVVYAYDAQTDGNRIIKRSGDVEYLSGWLLPGEDEAQILDKFNLDHSTELLLSPVPRAIKRVALKLTAYELTSAVQNQYGRSSKTVVTGGTTATIERQDTEFVKRELHKLLKYAVLTL